MYVNGDNSQANRIKKILVLMSKSADKTEKCFGRDVMPGNPKAVRQFVDDLKKVV